MLCQVSLSLSVGEQSALCQSVFHSLSLWVSEQHSRVSHSSPFLFIPLHHSFSKRHVYPAFALQYPWNPQHMLPFNVYHAGYARYILSHVMGYSDPVLSLNTSRVYCRVLCRIHLNICTLCGSLCHFILNHWNSEVKSIPGVDNLCEMTVFCTLNYSWGALFRPSYHILLFICTFLYNTHPVHLFLLYNVGDLIYGNMK